MRFIHTADWHLGNSMYRIDRASETDAFLRWLKERIVAEKADVLIVSGDIFDTVNPPTEARRKYFSFLSSLKETECRTVIITGGNHDSGMLLDAPAAVLEDLGGLSVHVVGSMGERSIEDAVFELYDAAGEVCGICAALPFMREMDLRRLVSESSDTADSASGTASADNADSEPEELFRAVYSRAYEAAERLRNGRNIPVIATGHLYAADLEGRGAETTEAAPNAIEAATNTDASSAPGTDATNTAPNSNATAAESAEDLADDGVRPLDIIGKLGRIHSSVFPAGFDYVALGHIHYTTMVAKNPKIRYSGSPFVLGFDEANIPHHVLNVSTEREKQPDVTKLEVPQLLHFMRVSGTVVEIAEKLKALSRVSERPLQNLFVEVCSVPEPGVDIHESLENILKDAPFTVANWKIQRTTSFSSGELYETGLDGAGQLTEKDVFSMLVKAKLGVDEDSDEYKSCMEELLPLFMEVANSISVGGDGAENSSDSAPNANNASIGDKGGNL